MPETREAIVASLETLSEIKAHREWVIDGLRAHVANVESDLARAGARVQELEKHAKNLETELAGIREHAINLERRLAERDARLAEVEAHAANLEHRAPKRSVRLAERAMFPEVRFARLSEIFRLGERIWSERGDLQQRFPRERAADYWYWLLWHGLPGREGEADARYPSPASHLIHRVVGELTGSDEYFRSGLVDWWQIDGCLREVGFDPVRGGSLLDFGAGCGRILQFFALYAKSCRLVGTDVDEDAMRWCTANFDFAECRTLPRLPPAPFESGEFDALYAFSVFSHLPESLHRAWLEEIARIVRPGAAVVITVHGRHVVDEIVSGRRRLEIPSARELERRLAELEASGFAFFPYGKLRFQDRENDRHFARWDLDQYGTAFILEPYVRARWTDLFELVAFHPAPDDWQDYAVLRRR